VCPAPVANSARAVPRVRSGRRRRAWRRQRRARGCGAAPPARAVRRAVQARGNRGSSCCAVIGRRPTHESQGGTASSRRTYRHVGAHRTPVEPTGPSASADCGRLQRPSGALPRLGREPWYPRLIVAGRPVIRAQVGFCFAIGLRAIRAHTSRMAKVLPHRHRGVRDGAESLNSSGRGCQQCRRSITRVPRQNARCPRRPVAAGFVNDDGPQGC
jgi:hypothetical protein